MVGRQPSSTFGNPSTSDYVLLFVLAGLWGASFMFIKVAVETAPAVSVTAVRIVIGALILLAAAWHAGQALPRGARTWGVIALAALFGNALPFTLITWGEERIDSGLAAILMALMPLITVTLAHFFTNDEGLTVRKTIGVLMGLLGLIILMGPSSLSGLGSDTIRQIAVASAAGCYAINALITKSLFSLPRRSLAAAIMLAAAVMMVPASLIVDQPWTLDAPSTDSMLATLALGVMQTAIATLMMLALIRKQGASFFSQINFMVPLFGVLWGALFLAERPSANAYLALAVILCGIAIARGRRQAT